MKVEIPTKTEKRERYLMLVLQGSMSYKQAQEAYAVYLRNTNQRK